MLQIISYIKALDIMPTEDALIKFVSSQNSVFDHNSFKLGYALASFQPDPSQQLNLGPRELYAFVSAFGHFDPQSMNFGANFERATRQQPEPQPETTKQEE